MASVSYSRITVHCIGNAHIDPVWRWPWQEGYAETLATCRAAIDRLRESNDFVFSRGQAATYAWIEEADPALFAEIRHYFSEGRWNIVNGWWEQPDCNIPCGESYVRQALYGKRWFREKFGVDVTTGWNPDTFGHNAGLPQILAKSGFTTYCFFRPGAHEKELPSFFWWQGPDGSRVLAIRPPVGHYNTWQNDLPADIRSSAHRAKEMDLAHSIHFYGVGNHGGGPTKENIRHIRQLHETPQEPDAIFSTVEAFYEAVRAHPFPTVADDLQHHAPGCYATHSEIKRLNRQAENQLLCAERWAALATLTLGRPYPNAEFTRAWKRLLFNQFHDILAGTSLPVAYDDARQELGEALTVAAHQQNTALQALAAQIDTRIDATEPPAAANGSPVLLFNPSSWERTDSAIVQWGWWPEHPSRLLDETGAEVPFQFIQPDIFGFGGSRIRFDATIPAHGFRVYRRIPATDSPTSQPDADRPTVGAHWMENRRYRLEFDAGSGSLIRLWDKLHSVEVIRAPACTLLVMDDPGDTWGHDIASWRNEVGRFGDPSFTITEEGPAAVALRIETRWQRSTARQEFLLYRETSRIDVTLTIDWHEQFKMLKLSVPVAIDEGTLTYDAPYSAIVREANGLEDPGQQWIDLSGKITAGPGRPVAYGVSLLNDSKYGFDCLGTDLRMSILRSPIFCFHEPAQPEPGREYLFLDQGPQTVRYALFPHAGTWQQAGTVREAYALNNRFAHLFQYPHPGVWGATGTLLKVEPSNVIAAAMKGAEDDSDLILRLFETAGAGGAVTVTLPEGRSIPVTMAPWELKTLRITPEDAASEVNLLEEGVQDTGSDNRVRVDLEHTHNVDTKIENDTEAQC